MQKQAQPDLSGLVRVEANTYPEALRQITQRFGKNVSIVHTRTVRRKGVLGFLGGTGVEVYVTGQAEYRAWRDRRAPSAAPDRGPKTATAAKTGTRSKALPPAPRSPDPAVQEEVTALLGRVHELIQQGFDSGEGSPDVGGLKVDEGLGGPDPRQRPGEKGPRHPVLREARRILEGAEFTDRAVRDLLAKLSRRRLPGTGGEAREVKTLARLQLQELVRKKVPPCMPIQISPGRDGPQVIALVGPTGVGKTTTIGKLASPLCLGKQGKVGLVTLDTYRIGAVDQLHKFAEIMRLPIKVVESGCSAKVAVDALRDCAVVLVDTAGRSQKDGGRLAEMRGMLDGIGGLEVHLCVSLASSLSTNLDVVRNFRAIPYNRVLFTKLDEASHHGGLLDIFEVARTPVSYMTFGQEVPDDIRAASVTRLEALLLGE